MALEPITRQEQIVAGKELKPITRMERFLKDYGVSKYFGETTVKGDTLTWDGNTEGLVNIMGMMFKVSDAVFTYDDIANGCSFVCNGKAMSNGQDAASDLGNFVVLEGGTYSFTEDAVGKEVGPGIIVPEIGTYFTWSDDADLKLTSLTIPGYNGFETTTIKPIDAKYLPPLVSPSGKKFKLSVDDSGVLSATEV